MEGGNSFTYHRNTRLVMAAPALPTVVLVHGAFADASGWQAVADGLRARGHQVLAPANPLRGVAADADYIRDFVSTIEGDVVLVGHSYGGCVITNASTDAPNVRALVYIAAFAPDEGETLLESIALGGGRTGLGEHLVQRPYPGAPEGDADGYLDLAFFHQLFCADLDAGLAHFMGVAQRGFALSCLSTPSGVPGWRTIPSWYLVAADDATIPPEAERAMAKRAGAHTVEVTASHVAMISKPAETIDLIVTASGG
ncbi:pimeloyl-ACP methyl ester carboxylesterase [Actinophytocola oryzae]|uniref:Pimeloyl-ACP methyl ester carboxylesterase n=1 Tax=Actinophytocola oryzae TaxID=502181 RepID=A0A4R7URZ9_9PSEU|nr:pimeloyl-ACP methyl ester carboxylesterase [Actinophytocola oryzae]